MPAFFDLIRDLLNVSMNQAAALIVLAAFALAAFAIYAVLSAARGKQ